MIVMRQALVWRARAAFESLYATTLTPDANSCSLESPHMGHRDWRMIICFDWLLRLAQHAKEV